MNPLRDLLSIAVTEIRKDRHMGRRERDVKAQVVRSAAALHVERLVALLDVERAEAQIHELRHNGKSAFATAAETFLDRAREDFIKAEQRLNSEQWCSTHRVSYLAGICIGCRWNLPATPETAEETVPASEDVEGPTVPAAIHLVGLSGRRS